MKNQAHLDPSSALLKDASFLSSASLIPSLAALIALVEKKTINQTIAKEVFEKIFADDIEPESYVKEHGLGMVSDTDALQKTVEEVIAANPQSVADNKAGKQKAIGFLVGQTMKAMKGKANPTAVNEILAKLLNE